MITYSSCPCCESPKINAALKVKDYTVSQDVFEIWECAVCTFRFTQHIPAAGAISKYYQSDNYISHTDTRKGLINQLYHKVRKRTLKSKRSLVNFFSGMSTGSILDIGAGTGAFLDTMKQGGWNVHGLEPDAETRARALQTYGLDLKSAELLYETPAASANAVTMWHVLEHVHELHNYIKEITRILKPGGTFFVAVPNYTSYDATFYKAFWAAYDVPRHLYHFSPASMKTLLNRHGLKLEAIKPMWYDSFYVSMLSEQYKNGRPALISAIFNGLLSNIKAIFNAEKCSSIIYVIKK